MIAYLDQHQQVRLIILLINTNNGMNIQNKLLNRQLKTTILQLKYPALKVLLENFEALTGSSSNSFYYKKGLKCAECVISFEDINQTGFGRTDQEAHANAIKSLFDSVAEQGHLVQSLKQSLKLVNKHKPKDEVLDLSHIDIDPNNQSCSYLNINTNCDLTTIVAEFTDISLDSSEMQNKDYNNFRRKVQPRKQQSKQLKPNINNNIGAQLSCSLGSYCVHQELHLQSQKKILHLEAKLKLLSQQNILLKQFLLKDFSNKQNYNISNILKN